LIVLLVVSFSISAQNVGIGTTTPTLGRLQVHGDVGRTAAIFGSNTYNLFSTIGAGISVKKRTQKKYRNKREQKMAI
jgi:hypothetical protein